MKCPHCNKEIPDNLITKYVTSNWGKKSASNLTKEQRVIRAKKAINTRWKNYEK